MASTNISRTQTGGNRKTWTLSVWLKRADIASDQVIFKSYTSANDHIYVRFNSNNDMYMESATGGASKISFTTNRKFRDIGAWMHVCLKVDMSQVTSTDRWKLFINGIDEADVGGYSSSNYASQNDDLAMNLNGATLYIGSHQSSGEYFEGVMSHYQYIDGLALAPTEFGEVDSTSGIWKIKTGSYGTPGTNGFHLKMEDSSNLDLDSSSNALTFTTTGTLTATKDNPSTNYPTGNPLLWSSSWTGSLTNGNNTLVGSSSGDTYNSLFSTLAAHKKGKWYAEFKLTTSGNADIIAGIASPEASQKSAQSAKIFSSSYITNGNGYGLSLYDGIVYYQNAGSTGQSDISGDMTQNDIVGIYLDLDANKIYFAKNGAVLNSGTGIAITNDIYNFTAADAAQSTAAGGDMNFGNGYFGTNVISGAVADAGGEGLFKYNPSTGTFDGSSKDFRCLNTKNIATYG